MKSYRTYDVLTGKASSKIIEIDVGDMSPKEASKYIIDLMTRVRSAK